MKKILVSVILILALLVNVSACGKKKNTTGAVSTTRPSTQAVQTQAPVKTTNPVQTTVPVVTTQSTQKPDTEKTVYDVLNGLTKQNYGKIKLNITTVTGDIRLNAQYVLTSGDVSYSVEQLNLLPTDGNFANISPEYKTTLKGTALIENGKITKIDGDAVNIPEYDELKGAFDFKESYFADVKISNGEFSADVTSVSKFIGTDKNISGLKIEVEYNDSAFEKITLTYKTANSTVTTVYEFQK